MTRTQQTRPKQLRPRPCPRCQHNTYTANVGPGTVQLDTNGHTIADGFRWSDTWHEWVSVQPSIHQPDGTPVYTLHQCTGPPREPPTPPARLF